MLLDIFKFLIRDDVAYVIGPGDSDVGCLGLQPGLNQHLAVLGEDILTVYGDIVAVFIFIIGAFLVVVVA